jgi:hypothetical protein
MTPEMLSGYLPERDYGKEVMRFARSGRLESAGTSVVRRPVRQEWLSASNLLHGVQIILVNRWYGA